MVEPRPLLDQTDEVLPGQPPHLVAEHPAAGLQSGEQLRGVRTRLLGWIVTAVLLIAGANAANLLFSPTVRWREEIRVRRAMGGSPSRSEEWCGSNQTDRRGLR
jgi:hypothetical protein